MAQQVNAWDWQRIGEVEVHFSNPAMRKGIVAFPNWWSRVQVDAFMQKHRDVQPGWDWAWVVGIVNNKEPQNPIDFKIIDTVFPESTKKIVNWRELSAGRQLDNYIAELLGWKGVKAYSAYDFATKPGDSIDVWSTIPHWSTNLNDAVKLPIDKGWTWHLAFDDSTGIWSACTWGDLSRTMNGNSISPALAVCYSWLARQPQP